MAIMIPEKPRKYDNASLEGYMFNALMNGLPNEYVVFHSFRTVFLSDNTVSEHEADFVILNKDKGLLFLEAKAGHVKYEKGVWKYANGVEMKHDGPFNQADSNKYRLLKYIRDDLGYRNIVGHCKFTHAVWFPSLEQAEIDAQNLPLEALRDLIIPKESLDYPEQYMEEYIAKIMDMDVESGTTTNLSDSEYKVLLEQVLCPEFNVLPSKAIAVGLNDILFHQMTREQYKVLDFLDEQQSVVISGAAGTGKTMVAVERARRYSETGDGGLFLCYNSMLKEKLAESFPYNNVEYYTIDGFACKLCKTSTSDFEKLKNKLLELKKLGLFPYKHIIVDEGQDFGKEDLVHVDILNSLYECILSTSSGDSTFCVFYDMNQAVYGSKIPLFLSEADCKVTLHTNCRNTRNIAQTSLSTIKMPRHQMLDGAEDGDYVHISFCEDDSAAINRVDNLLEQLAIKGINDVVILSCADSIHSSVLKSYINDDLYKNRCTAVTAKRFKGLEADAVILTDVDAGAFSDSKHQNIFYVGTSRAKYILHIVTTMTEKDCENALMKIDLNKGKSDPQPRPKPLKALVRELKARNFVAEMQD